MSVLKGLQEYIQSYPGVELIVLTDRTDDRINSYALFPSGGGRRASDIYGNKTYVKSYVFYAKRAISEEFERQENYDFLEGFCDWVEDNCDRGIFPDIGEDMTVEALDVANIMLMDLTDGWDVGTYQIQLSLKYEKSNGLGL